MIEITLKNRISQLITKTSGETSVTLTHDQPYGFEDELTITARPGSYVLVDIDQYIEPSILYTPTGIIHYVIPAGWKTKAYNPEAFKTDTISVTASYADETLLKTRRNLALNGFDLRWDTGYYPHASANVVTRDEPWFEAKNAIDGKLERDGHGQFPFQSWGGGLRDDLEFVLDFGREVLIDEIKIYLRADFEDDHDIHWESGQLEFSTGETMTIHMSGSNEADVISFEPKKVTWIKLNKLKREISAAFSALTQIEVFGTES